MDEANKVTDKSRLLMGIYKLSWGNSMTALTVVAVLEVFMLVYSVVDTPLFGEHLWTYRAFYIALLSAALIYIALNFFVKKDIEHRYKLLNIANPLYAAFFFAWSLGITYFDAMKFGTVDPTVFMTFSLTVPLSFYLFPSVYAAIALVADAAIVYITVSVTGSVAPLINISIFCIFQFVLGISFLRLKVRLTERILEEQKNADIDVLTGFPNRRLYEKDIRRLAEESEHGDLVYASIDLNGLKEVNDQFGHEAGDKLIVGAAQCIEQCFGDKGTAYRIGGDEFVVLISADENELSQLFNNLDEAMQLWSRNNDMLLTAAYGYARQADYPDKNVSELFRVADQRMYASKAQYYQTNGKDRRRHRAEGISS